MFSKYRESDHFPLILNSNDIVPFSNNSEFQYNFPSGNALFKGAKVALANVGIYYSWYNITAANGNNSFSYVWYNFAGSSVHNVTIADGYYSAADLNSYLQNVMVQNGHYLIDNSNNYRYYIEILENSTYYSLQVNEYPIPTSLPAGWTNPAAITFPAVASTPQFIVPTTNFRNLIGFNAGTYPAVTQSTNYTKLSDFTPQLAPIQSLIMLCSLLDNRYSNPKTVLHSFTVTNTTFGSAFNSQPNQLIFIPVVDGTYQSINIKFVDQNFNNIAIQDPNIVISLVFETKTEGLSY